MHKFNYSYRFSKKEILVYKIFFSSVILGIIIHFLSLLKGSVAVLTVLTSVLTGFLGILIYFLNFPTNKYTKWLLFLLMYFLFVGISYGNFNPNFRGGDFMWIVTQDLRYVMYFLMGSVFAQQRYMPLFHKIMQFLGISSIFAAIISLVLFDFDISMISGRSSGWNISYFLWWLSASCYSYWGYYGIVMKKEKFLSYGVLLSYFLLGVLFLKRSAFINVFLVVLIGYVLANRNFIKSSIRISSLLMFVFVFVVLLNQLFNSNTDIIFKLLFSRFSLIDNIEDIDRIIEWKAYFENSSIRQLLLGNGIGYYPYLEISNNVFLDKVNSLHIGLFNILFKGGILYLIFYSLLYMKVFQSMFNSRSLGKYEMVCLGVAISAFISLFYEGSWTYTIEPFCISAPIFYIAQSKNNG